MTYVGTVPDRELSHSLADWIAATSLPPDAWRAARPASVTCTSATTADGATLRFVHNWAWEPADCHLPAGVRDLLTGEPLAAGTALALGPWDVRVLIESAGETPTNHTSPRRTP
ncbi:Beta-galactosidase C-terminal domain [Streptomyces galilaeus]